MVEYEICADNYQPDSHDGIVFVASVTKKVLSLSKRLDFILSKLKKKMCSTKVISIE